MKFLINPMKKEHSGLIAEVAEYYTSKLAMHGETPQGVDWNGQESQTLRFRQLCKVIRDKNSFSINDLGCGYGAFYEFLNNEYETFSYSGIDVSEDMINAAERRFGDGNNIRLILSDKPDRISDYSVASGIFNVRFNRSEEEWRTYLETTLDILDETSRIGFSFNCLTSYSDSDKMRDNLYYPDPGVLFDLCKRRYSRNVALLHDYGLFEFTIIVKKQL